MKNELIVLNSSHKKIDSHVLQKQKEAFKFLISATNTVRVIQNPSFLSNSLMAATKFSDYLGLKDYKKAKKHTKHFIHLRLTQWP